MDEIKKNVYITYVEVLQDGYKTMLRTLRTPNPEFEAYGAKKCNERLTTARLAVEKITYNMLKDYKEDIKRVGNPELSEICHDFFLLDLNGCLRMVAEPLQTEWWLLANRLKQRFMDLQKLEIISVEKTNQSLKEKSIESFMNDDQDGKKLEVIRRLITGKIGKNAALVIHCAMKQGWMERPTTRIVAEEFGNIGSPKGFDAYLRTPEKFKEDEITNMMKNFVLKP